MRNESTCGLARIGSELFQRNAAPTCTVSARLRPSNIGTWSPLLLTVTCAVFASVRRSNEDEWAAVGDDRSDAPSPGKGSVAVLSAFHSEAPERSAAWTVRPRKEVAPGITATLDVTRPPVVTACSEAPEAVRISFAGFK